MARNYKYHFIYHIRILIGSKKDYFYVGLHSTNNIDDGYCGSGRRVRNIINGLRKKGHKDSEIYKRTILTFATTREEATELEAIYVTEKIRDNAFCLNNRTGGEGCGLHSDETRAKMSKAAKGRKISNEQRAKMTKANKGKRWYNNGIDEGKYFKGEQPGGWVRGRLSKEMKGKHWYNNAVNQCKYFEGEQPEGWVRGRLETSDETRKKISQAIKGKYTGENNKRFGKKLSSETRAKMSKARKGKKCSDETRAKISKANKGKTSVNKGKHLSDEHRSKISKNHGAKGKHWYNNGINENLFFDGEQPEGWVRGALKPSDETRSKMSKSAKGRKISDEQREKIGNAFRGKHWYNNGIEECQYFDGEQPEGWFRGMLKRKKSA